MHRYPQLLSSLLATTLLCPINAIKMTPMIKSCMAQTESRIGDETDGRVKTAITSMINSLKSGDIVAAQKVVNSNSEAERTATLNKYMVDECAPMKTCFLCPVNLE